MHFGCHMGDTTEFAGTMDPLPSTFIQLTEVDFTGVA